MVERLERCWFSRNKLRLPTLATANDNKGNVNRDKGPETAQGPVRIHDPTSPVSGSQKWPIAASTTLTEIDMWDQSA
jgi:hypothetical protein